MVKVFTTIILKAAGQPKQTFKRIRPMKLSKWPTLGGTVLINFRDKQGPSNFPFRVAAEGPLWEDSPEASYTFAASPRKSELQMLLKTLSEDKNWEQVDF